MTYSKLPGVYFSETVGAVSITGETIPLFIVQTSTAIAAIDDQYIKFNNITAFKTTVADKGLTNTVDIIEEALTEAGMTNNAFYVYSIKTDTAAAFTAALVESSNLNEVEDVIYIEETKSGSGNTINSKLGALKTGANTCAENGVNRVCYVVPYGTVDDAIDNKSSGTDEAVCISTLTTAVNGINSGRVAVIVPDYAGAVLGRVLAADYNEEIGYDEITTAITPALNFSYSEMITLQNLGIMFIRGEKLRGSYTYRVNLGVSTAFSGNGADGLLISRRICDEVLRQVKYVCDDFVKAPQDFDAGLAVLQTDIDNIIDDFGERSEIFIDESELTVNEGSDVYTLTVNGKIKPVKSTIAIDVNTTLA